MLPESLHLFGPSFLRTLDVTQLDAQITQFFVALKMAGADLIDDCNGLFDEIGCGCRL